MTRGRRAQSVLGRHLLARRVPGPAYRRQTAASLGLAHPERLAFRDDHTGVVEEAVEHGDGGGVVGQEAAPLVEGPVAGQAQAAALVGGGHEAEEELAAVGVEGREAKLVTDVNVKGKTRRRDREMTRRKDR